MITLILLGCEFDPGNEGYIPPPFSPPPQFFVESISDNSVKISWTSDYTASVIVERSENRDSLFTIIQPNVTFNYFIDQGLDKAKEYYYRFRGKRNNDTSYATYLAIKNDSTNRLMHVQYLIPSIDAVSSSDDRSSIALVNGERRGFEVRKYSDLSLMSEKTSSMIGVSVFNSANFSADGNKIVVWNGPNASCITLSPHGKIPFSVPDSFFIQNIIFIDNDTKVLQLLMHKNYLYCTAAVMDLATTSVVQSFDSISVVNLGYSAVSPDRKKVIWRVKNGFLLFEVSTTVTMKHIDLNTTHTAYFFLKNSNSVMGIKHNTIDVIDLESGSVTKSTAAKIYNGQYFELMPKEDKIIAFTAYEPDAIIYDVVRGELDRRVGFSDEKVKAKGIACSPDGATFIIAYNNGTIRKYSTELFDRAWQKIN